MKKCTLSVSRIHVFEKISCEFALPIEDVESIYENLLLEEISEEELFYLIDSVLNVEDEIFDPSSLPSIVSNSIYNMDTDEDIQKYLEIELMRLNEGSAAVEDFNKLEEQAVMYFKNPELYPLVEDNTCQYLKCFIEFYSHSLFDQDGTLVDYYRSSGLSFECSLEDVEDTSFFNERLCSFGLFLDNSVRIKVYGLNLYDIVGARAYKIGEKTQFLAPYKELPNLLFAVPDSDAVCDYSIDSSLRLNSLITSEIKYGRSINDILGGAIISWVLDNEFYEERYPQMKFEEEELCFNTRLMNLYKKHCKFKDGFAFEIDLINKINQGEVKLSEVSSLSNHQINRILYVCKSNQFKVRLCSKAIYMQLLAVVRRNSQAYKLAS
jgi:hypothetical protein